MEHIVDTVLYLEGEATQTYKVLRAVKNRFGSTNEIGLFEMREEGLREVRNPSGALLSQRPTGLSGTGVVCTLEGSRPLLVEVQALASPSYLGVPRRVVTGLDYNRVCLLLAVLEKRGGFNLAHQDVYVNVAGGIRVLEPAVDLGVTLAVASSCRGLPLPPEWVVFGEVGLAGEVRAVHRPQQRLGEAARLGFTVGLLPAHQSQELQPPDGLRLSPVSTLRQALDIALSEEETEP
jgi:DNA repair protein RadA/Sms